ncbi:MAG: hypothetical protein NZT92_08570 [Abditibacteriales bacterium]|nr:hypothetical protein [Abditibacteriales bacterium]MDW8365438.1 hypothetical protein [Abditibacteriales bacterium]
MGKLTRVHVVLIAAGIAVVIGVAWFFALMKPLNERIAATQREIDGYETAIHACLPESVLTHGEEPKKLHNNFSTLLRDPKHSKYQQNLQKARADNDKLRAQLKYFKDNMRIITFKTAEGDQDAWKAILHEFHEVIKPEFDEFMRSAGLPVSYNFTPDAPPAIWTAVKAPSSSFIKLPASGQIQVQVVGKYTDIIRFLNHLTSWNRLIGVGAIRLSGQSPNITATFPVSIFILADVPESVLSAGGGAPGGMPGMGGPMDMSMAGMGGMTGGMMAGPEAAGGAPMGSPPPPPADAGGGTTKEGEELGDTGGARGAFGRLRGGGE